MKGIWLALAVAIPVAGAMVIGIHIGEVSVRQKLYVEKFELPSASGAGFQYFGECYVERPFYYCPQIKGVSETK